MQVKRIIPVALAVITLVAVVLATLPSSHSRQPDAPVPIYLQQRYNQQLQGQWEYSHAASWQYDREGALEGRRETRHTLSLEEDDYFEWKTDIIRSIWEVNREPAQKTDQIHVSYRVTGLWKTGQEFGKTSTGDFIYLRGNTEELLINGKRVSEVPLFMLMRALDLLSKEHLLHIGWRDDLRLQLFGPIDASWLWSARLLFSLDETTLNLERYIGGSTGWVERTFSKVPPDTI